MPLFVPLPWQQLWRQSSDVRLGQGVPDYTQDPINLSPITANSGDKKKAVTFDIQIFGSVVRIYILSVAV